MKVTQALESESSVRICDVSLHFPSAHFQFPIYAHSPTRYSQIVPVVSSSLTHELVLFIGQNGAN